MDLTPLHYPHPDSGERPDYEILGLDAATEATYRALLIRPDADRSTLSRVTGRSLPDLTAALERLVARGLARPAAEAACGITAVAPELGLAASLAQGEAELAERRRRLEQGRAAMARLVADHAVSRHGRRERRVERLSGAEAVARRIGELLSAAEREVLSLDPSSLRAGEQSRRDCGTGQPGWTFTPAAGWAASGLRPGVGCRVIHVNAVRGDASQVRRLHAMSGDGVKVRTLPSLPLRMLVIDGAVAVLPSATPTSGGSRGGASQQVDPGAAIVLVSPLVAQALCALFESLWAKAAPLGQETPQRVGGLTPAERELLRLLGTGLTDEGASRELGLSLRTVRRMMSELMARLEAKSRFQAGVRVAERRWL